VDVDGERVGRDGGQGVIAGRASIAIAPLSLQPSMPHNQKQSMINSNGI
jgi:hypothetical protein